MPPERFYLSPANRTGDSFVGGAIPAFRFRVPSATAIVPVSQAENGGISVVGGPSFAMMKQELRNTENSGL